MKMTHYKYVRLIELLGGMPRKRKRMKSPNHISSLAMHNLVDCQKEIDGKWQPARPMGYQSLFGRFRLAWWVFVGKADALTWPGQ